MKGAKKSTRSKSAAKVKVSAPTKSSTKQPIKSRTKPAAKKPEKKNPEKNLVPLVTQEKSISSMQHHEVNEMVSHAIASLKEKKGSSLKSITNFIVKTYKVDAGKQGAQIRKYLKTATVNDKIIKVKSNRSSGKFMLPEETVTAKGKKPAPKKASKNAKISEKLDGASKKSEQPRKQAAVKRPAAADTRQNAAASKKQKTVVNSKKSNPKNSKKAKEVKAPVAKAAASKSRKVGKGKRK